MKNIKSIQLSESDNEFIDRMNKSDKEFKELCDTFLNLDMVGSYLKVVDDPKLMGPHQEE